MSKKVKSTKSANEIAETLAVSTTAKLEKASEKLVKTYSDYSKVAEDQVKVLGDSITTLTVQLTDLVEAVTEKEVELIEITKKLEIAKNDADYAIKTHVRDSEVRAVSEYAEKNGLVVVTKNEVSDLKDQIITLTKQLEAEKERFDETLASKVEEKINEQVKILGLEFQAKESECNAEVRSYKAQNDLLVSQVNDLKSMIAKERESKIEIEKARTPKVQYMKSDSDETKK